MIIEGPQEFQDLVLDERRALAYLATTMADGSPPTQAARGE